MLQNANNGIPGLIEDSQYLRLVVSSSLILISLQDSAASSGMEPSGTCKNQTKLESLIWRYAFVRDKINNIQVTSIDRFSEIISIWIKNEIFRFGFFGSIIQLTHAWGYHKIEALATVICATDQPTRKTDIGRHCFIDVSLQHPSADGPFRGALLSHRFLNNMKYHKSNTEPEKSGHFLTVTQYLKDNWNYTITCVVAVC